MARTSRRIDSFDFKPGRRLAGKYIVDTFIGGGWEGEVYKVIEERTGITRAAKLFFPHRNPDDTAVRRYARKLDHLRNCNAIIQYHNTESVRVRNQEVTCLISEFVEGELLTRLVARQPRGRMHHYEALCLLHSLTVGVEQIHAAAEYHGDLHADNILVARRGIFFDVRIVDFYERGPGRRHAQQDDVVDLIHLFYHALGGRPAYRGQPAVVKNICKGLRRDLVLAQFPTAARLRHYIESFDWLP